MEEQENLARCGICDYINVESKVQEHFKKHFTDGTETEDCVLDTGTEQQNETVEDEVVMLNETGTTVQGKVPFKWATDDVKLLIGMYEEHKYDFSNPRKTNRSVWNAIAAKMIKHDVHVNWEQCETKFKNMKKTYKTIVDHNNSTGRGRKHWQFFDMMDNIFRKNPEVSPNFIVNTSSFACDSENTMIENQSNNSETLSEINIVTPPSVVYDSPCTSQSPFIKKRRNKENEEPVWFKRYREDAQKRHEEKISMQRQLLDTLNRLITTNK